MRVLIVEDEPKTATFLRKGLEEQGFQVETRSDGRQGLDLALANDYGCLILDIMLPGLKGWEVLAELRREGRTTPVIFLTARDEVEDRVRGLNLGADDYLVKPFAFSELLARVRSLLRRGPALSPEILKIADLAVDCPKRIAKRAGNALHLTTREFDLLVLLARRAGHVLSRTMILEQVWDMNFDSDANVVDVAIRRLRRKVDDPFPDKLIHTVRGAGYVLDDSPEWR